MDNQPILSLCIPTNGAVDWVLPVLDSIYCQNYDQSKFEVVITDNGKDSQLESHLKEFKYSNLRYIPTSDEGFLNLVSCLKEGRGLFCKMINHRSIMLPDSISEMVSLINRYKGSQPIIYCSDGNIKLNEDLIECPNIDCFVRTLTYWCSWSGGIGFWQKDISKFDHIELNPMFPNTSLLFEVREDSQFLIWNKKYDKMQGDSGKGGYDLFRTFGIILLDIINNLRIQKRITEETFSVVKKNLYRFLCKLFLLEVLLPNNHTFIIKDVAKSMNVYYGCYYYYKMKVISYVLLPFAYLKMLARMFFNCFK